MFKNKYRIVTDNYAGYEVQIRKWWFPFWVECFSDSFITNTHLSIDAAKEFIKNTRMVM